MVIKPKASIAFGIVHPNRVSFDWHRSVLRSLAAGYAVAEIDIKSGVNITRARNQVLKNFLNESFENLLFTDGDVSWDPEDVQALLDRDLPIVGGLYYGWGGDGQFPVYAMQDETGELVRPEPPKELQEVFGLGMGFTLIKREVIEALAPIGILYPFGEFDWGEPPGKYALGEDIGFCYRAREKGFKSYLDATIHVGHAKEITI